MCLLRGDNAKLIAAYGENASLPNESLNRVVSNCTEQGFTMRLQKLVVVMALVGAIGAEKASALGLGEVKLHSALNQPLLAEIELLQVQGLTKNEILPNLASRADFERAGIARPFSLTDIRFKTEIDERGRAVIKIISRKPIQEPFVNLLMEVHWPSGRLLREYTLLLDPPAFSDQLSAPVQPPATPSPSGYGAFPVPSQEVATGRDFLPPPNEFNNRTGSSEQMQQPDRRVRKTVQASQSRPATGESYKVQSDDNLWNIAESIRGNLTVQQAMVAIQRENAGAFIGNNINRLKSGKVLRLPDSAVIGQITVREAITEVARQNREWRDRGKVAQLDATRRSAAEMGGKKPEGDGKLAIVSADSSTGQGQDLGGGESSEANGTVQNELAMTRERLDALSSENAELKSRLKDLDDQVATLNRLVTLKDDQMTALQAQGQKEIAKPDVADKPKEKNVPKPLPESKVTSEPGIIDFLLGNPLLIALVAVVPLLLVGLLMYRRRRQEEEFDEDDLAEPVELGSGLPEMPEQDDLDLDLDLELDESLETDDSLPELGDEEETTQQTEDAISEADIYIAYGRFNQAADLLVQAIGSEPERSDLRLKLLEVHAENNDVESFRDVLGQLEKLGDQDALQRAEVFKARFPAESFSGVTADGTGNDLADIDLDDLDLDDDQIEASADVDLDDFEFDLDELEDEAVNAGPDVEEAESKKDDSLGLGPGC